MFVGGKPQTTAIPIPLLVNTDPGPRYQEQMIWRDVSYSILDIRSTLKMIFIRAAE